ncbi:HD domain-containing protein [Amycolatopsis mediterranei]|uniref:Metal dependent phosphohydrolase n=2 Tax=Amycolatopsis mediterranei TaxID=33910 RepID=A0A9R0NQQ9_AMYMS|nr:HD domain-containing protein [Amycolatopsis mediterranei]ABX56683.1 metal dependent phosphohydrolase [Amycolatopsis mediterranei]AEK38877.1 metal dependent phosphohydrolase [Amycolatopsis mediterranei S699]UZF67378.1 HD domain-containing protein [Amycolatopsis mediterranei]
MADDERAHRADATELVSSAAALAEDFVAPLGQRWIHVQAVATRAGDLARAVPAEDRATLVAAAWLHDIGYSPRINHTGFHPLDGARFLRQAGWSGEIVNLVAHHSGARFEAEQRGMSVDLKEFPFADNAVLDALVAADLTTGPQGQSLTYDERIQEILRRYPPNDPVHKTWLHAAPILKEAVRRVEAKLA